MNRTRTNGVLRGIERVLVSLGSVCLIWVGAVSMHALTYQVEQNARLTRLGPSGDNLAVDRSRDAFVSKTEANVPVGRLEIPRIGLSAIVMEGDDEQTLNVAVGHLPDTPLPW